MYRKSRKKGPRKNQGAKNSRENNEISKYIKKINKKKEVNLYKFYKIFSTQRHLSLVRTACQPSYIG